MMDTLDVQTMLGAAALAFLPRATGNFIAGTWQPPLAGQTMDVIDPGTGKIAAQIPASTAADIDAAVSAARAALETGSWPRLPGTERGRLILKLAAKLGDAAEELAQLESLDTGRPIYECRLVDIPGSVAMLEYMAGWASKINGEQISLGLPGDLHAYSLREPVGVVGIILPWNYPLELAVWRMAPALAAGCTIVLKPAEQTALSTLRLGELVAEAGFPPGVVNVVAGTGEAAGVALANHPDVDAISFTGSTETGKSVARAATGNLKRVFLELGGKSPMIVLKDADLDAAIPGVAGSIFFSSGQVCTAGSRLFVERPVFDRVLDGVVAYAEKLRIGHGLLPDTQLGPLVSEAQLQRVLAYLDRGRADGVTLATGGDKLDTSGYFIRPTVVTGTKPGMAIWREEIFGPVLCMEAFEEDDWNGVVSAANDSIYGLHASIWTKGLRAAHDLARQLKAGNVCINTHNFFDPAFPMGGYKQSGWGRASGFAAIEHYTELKAVVARL